MSSRSRSRQRHRKNKDVIHKKRGSYSFGTNNKINNSNSIVRNSKICNNYNYYNKCKYSNNHNHYYHNHNHKHKHNHYHYHYHYHNSNNNKRKPKLSSEEDEEEERGDDADDLEGTVNLRNITSIYSDRYTIGKKLGQGTFGSVIECIDNKRNIKVAMKIVRSVKRYLDAAEIEVEILNKLDKLDILRNSLTIRLYKSFRCVINNIEHLCLVTEKCGRSLYDYIKKNKYIGFTYDVVGIIGYQLFHSIEFCHNNKLTHTDLKLENILFAADEYYYDKKLKLYLPDSHYLPYEIRLIDFGGATFEYDHHSSIINTRQYRGPEVILKKKWSYPSDIWSIGCILSELYTGELLFATHSDTEHLNLIKKILDIKKCDNYLNVPSIKNQKSIRYVEKSKKLNQIIKDEKLSDLIYKCLKVDPNKRITAKEAKKHPFFRQFRNDTKNTEFNKIYNMINQHK